MSETSTVITFTLPPSDRLDGQGTLLIQRGTLAHLTQFTYIGLQDITAAIQAASIALAALESHPPLISEMTPPAPEPGSKVTTSTPAEPTWQIPVGKKTQRILQRVLQLARPEQQALGIEIASRLLASKLWDGHSPIRITDAALTLKKLKPLDDKTLSLFTLADFVESGDSELSVPVPDIAAERSAAAPSTDETPPLFHVGQRVQLTEGATDRDGDVIPFNIGRIVEVDATEDSLQVWVESADGDHDVWVSALFLQPLTTDL